MLSVIAFILAFIVFVLTIIPGIIMFLTTIKKLSKEDVDRKSIWKTWFLGNGITGILWGVVITLSVHFSSGGAPTEEDWGNLYKLFAMSGALPGICLFFGGIFQRLWLQKMRKQRNT